MRIRYLFAAAAVLVLLAACGTPPDVTDVAPTPSAIFNDYIGMSQYALMTTEQVGNIPAETLVRVSQARFTEDGWIYTVVMQDEVTIAEATESQLRLSPDVTPGPTPTAAG